MMQSIIADNPLCDGRNCTRRASCARWIVLCDRTRRTPWPILSNKAPVPARGCPLWLKIPHPAYPHTPTPPDK